MVRRKATGLLLKSPQPLLQLRDLGSKAAVILNETLNKDGRIP